MSVTPQPKQLYCTSVILEFEYRWKGSIKTQRINPEMDEWAIQFVEEKDRGGGEVTGGLVLSGYCLTNQARRSFFFSRITSRIRVDESKELS